MLESALADARYALRQLCKTPAFSAVAILTLALGIGATTAIFSVVYGVLLRPLPYPDPDRIVAVFELTTKGRPSRLADPNFDDFCGQSRSFAALAKWSDFEVSVAGASEPTRTRVAAVSPAFLKVLGVLPALGRDFDLSDARQGAAPTLLVSHDYWRLRLGSPRDLAPLRLKVDDAVFSVIGVLPPGFRYPPDVDLWLAADLEGANPSRTSHNYSAVGRLREGVTVAQAKADVSAIARRIRASSSEQGDYLLADATVVPLHESLTGRTRPALLVLLAAVGFLLLVACANVANLQLAQAAARGRELAVRSALGALRGRLMRQFLTEALLLSLAAGALGVLGAIAGVRGLVALAPPELPRLESVSVSLPVLGFALLVSTVVAGGLGAFTAARATAVRVSETLVHGGRGQAGSAGAQRVGRVIVAAQIAITLVLAVGAGLFARSLVKVLEVDPGFRVEQVLTMDVALPWRDDPAAKAGQARFFADLLDRLGRVPGVRLAGATGGLPMDGGHPDGLFLVMGSASGPVTPELLERLFQQKERLGSADFCPATASYFRVLGIPLVRGRLFDEHDGPDSPHVAVISDSLAKTRWPGQDPIGQAIEFGNMDGDLRLITIVGVVGDTHEYGLESPPRPTVYVNLLQRPRPQASVALHTLGDPGPIVSAARAVVQQLDPEVPVRFRTLSQVVSATLGSRRFNAILVGCFGLTALVLATSGVFGVMAYSVSRRTREIGVRLALGAARSDVSGMILRQGLRTILAGVAVGALIALALTRTLRSLLFGVSATDPLTFAAVALALVGAALVACYVPARRATRVDPIEALRCD
jgi:putative ABC transport system permease protein